MQGENVSGRDDTIRVRLLTGADILIEGHSDLDWKGRIPRIVFAILALSPGIAVSRDRIAGLVWPESDQAAARRNLRMALTTLRKGLRPVGDDLITADQDTVCLRLDPTQVDACLMGRLAAERTVQEAERALALFGGAMLPDLRMPSAEIADYFVLVTDRCRGLVLEAGHWLLAECVADARTDRAASVARRLLEIAPTDEEAHRALIQYHLRRGDRAGALQQFDRCVAVLKRDLDVAPSAETQDLHRKILSDVPASRDDGLPSIPVALVSAPINIVPSRRYLLRLVRLARSGPILLGLGIAVSLGLAVLVYRAAVRPDAEPQPMTKQIIALAPVVADPAPCATPSLARDLERLQQSALVSLPNVAVLLGGAHVDPQGDPVSTLRTRTALQCSGNEVRVTVEVWATATGEMVWAGQYNGSQAALDALMDRIIADLGPWLADWSR
ncbi:hypothetical protein H0I76_07350 [Limibaculum sp. M0105]|uniref:Bacterial transcriptional activator domain-containing protein n=1 Tax=Thermohalobaculum xanthum TaxID=2753746 RepID=A0A8J7M7A4_9RHOB|nr:BTAD domain-containing putative transcriptional regulator [Thermohalobaculum xanthum]MBK0399000.1 hypothetical protein [Thermohalobaculum xanthum]